MRAARADASGGGRRGQARDRLGAMPLSYAARSGHLALVDLLLENGAPINARNLAGSTALYFAAENDRLAVTRRLLAKGADPSLSGRGGVTPIAAAAYMGNDRTIEVLLAHGVDPNGIDKTGKAPIVYAASLGFAPVVRRLLDAGVDVNARYGNELTVLIWAAGYAENAGALDAEVVVNLLLDRGAAIDAVDNRGRSALMTAAELGHAASSTSCSPAARTGTLKDREGKSAVDLSGPAPRETGGETIAVSRKKPAPDLARRGSRFCEKTGADTASKSRTRTPRAP